MGITSDLPPRRRWRAFTKEREAYLRANAGVDAALLAQDLGVTTRFVIMFQRRLGLRRMTDPRDYLRDAL
jgi:hypothetical protein